VNKVVNNNKTTPRIFSGYFCFISCLLILFLSSPILLKSQKTSQIEIINANSLEFDQSLGNNAKRLIGNVQFKHDDALMFCDSAYFYSETNSMDAFSRVRITQGDSLQLFGDSLNYSGTTKKALLRGNIRLINTDVTLTTNYLDYDRANNVAYYFGGGTLISKKENNTLTSKQGYYYPETKSFFFKQEVHLTNPEYTIDCDTMQYNSDSKITYFYGPTTITNKDQFIYCENGWYNTKTNVSNFFNNAYLYSDKKIIKGDTLYYERNTGYGEIKCNGSINDTIENIVLEGDLIRLFQQKDSVMITKEALLKQIFTDDTLFMHADTFKLSTQFIKNDSVPNQTDTIRNLFAYNHVKFFKLDMQGKADSVLYNFSDSTVNFYNDPIIWSGENQLTADTIYLLMKNKKIDAIYLNTDAFIISKADSLFDHFNQIKGDNMIGYFANDELHKIDVIQNAETIYYGRDDEGKYIGVNKAKGNNMLIFIDNNQLSSLTFIKDPEATLYPIKEPSPKDVILKGYNWRITERPKQVLDIFVR
jgi:lipopolysaccharide export system protein LptA